MHIFTAQFCHAVHKRNYGEVTVLIQTCSLITFGYITVKIIKIGQ